MHDEIKYLMIEDEVKYKNNINKAKQSHIQHEFLLKNYWFGGR